MKKRITFSADGELIQQARERAAADHTTLNKLFEEWLVSYIETQERMRQYHELMERLRHIDVGGPFTRDEMNERR